MHCVPCTHIISTVNSAFSYTLLCISIYVINIIIIILLVEYSTNENDKLKFNLEHVCTYNNVDFFFTLCVRCYLISLTPIVIFFFRETAPQQKLV